MKNSPAGTPIDKEERDLAESLFTLTEKPASLLTPESRAGFEAMARATMDEQREKISLHVPRTDLVKLKSRALQEGVPYHTLINSLIHKYVSG